VNVQQSFAQQEANNLFYKVYTSIRYANILDYLRMMCSAKWLGQYSVFIKISADILFLAKMLTRYSNLPTGRDRRSLANHKQIMDLIR
jgi:hypothetical protein